MRRQPSVWVGIAASCDQLPAYVREARDTLAYALGKADGRREADDRWREQARRALELAQFWEQFDDPEYDQ
jgi:hypothetical protein